MALAAARRGSASSRAEAGRPVEQWGIFEVALPGPSAGNPFIEVELSARFSQGDRPLDVARLLRRRRDLSGPLHARIARANGATRRGATGPSWTARRAVRGGQAVGRQPRAGPGAQRRSTSPTPTARPYFPVGTTCYAWTHQGDSLEEQTLATLKASPFNKIRMCVFPKYYAFNRNEPPLYPFAGTPPRDWDFTRFNPAFFRHLERTDRPAPRPGDRGRPDPLPPLRQGPLGLRPDARRGRRPLPPLRRRPARGLPQRLVVAGERVGLHEGEDRRRLGPVLPDRRRRATPTATSARSTTARCSTTTHSPG